MVDVTAVEPRCEHPDTFDCHGTPRCTLCFADMEPRPNGQWEWSSQERPDRWDPQRIANWFRDSRVWQLPQGCDGFEFCRNNVLDERPYGYVWVELTLDLDFDMGFLLDVRKHDGDDEYRQFMFVAMDHNGTHCALYDEPRTIFSKIDHIAHLARAIRWFGDQTEQWLRNRP